MPTLAACQISKAEKQNWRGVNTHQEIVNFSLEKRKRQIPNAHRRIKESASVEVFEQAWRLVLHCTSIQQHLSNLFSSGIVVKVKSNSSLQCIAITPALGIDVGTGVQ